MHTAGSRDGSTFAFFLGQMTGIKERTIHPQCLAIRPRRLLPRGDVPAIRKYSVRTSRNCGFGLYCLCDLVMQLTAFGTEGIDGDFPCPDSFTQPSNIFIEIASRAISVHTSFDRARISR